MSGYKEIDITKVKTISISNRQSKVAAEVFAGVAEKGQSFAAFWNSLPQILKAKDLQEFVDLIERKKKGEEYEVKTSISKSIISHLMAFAADKARLAQKVVDFKEFTS